MAKARQKQKKTLSKRKSKRRSARSSPSESASQQPEDAMSRCVALCQEGRWREAAMLSRKLCEKANNEGKVELYVSLAGARQKIEYSLRRQKAAALVQAAKDLLKKEYLLDVG